MSELLEKFGIDVTHFGVGRAAPVFLWRTLGMASIEWWILSFFELALVDNFQGLPNASSFDMNTMVRSW